MDIKISTYPVTSRESSDTPGISRHDSVYPTVDDNADGERLFLVCDGGTADGAKGARAVCVALAESILTGAYDGKGFFTDNMLEKAIDYAYERLDGAASPDGAGVSMALLKLHDEGATVTNAGNCQVLLLRPAPGRAKIVFSTPECEPMHPDADRHMAAISHITDLCPGDCMVISTAALLDKAGKTRLAEIFALPSMEERIAALDEIAKSCGDDASAWIVRVDDIASVPDQEEVTVVAAPAQRTSGRQTLLFFLIAFVVAAIVTVVISSLLHRSNTPSLDEDTPTTTLEEMQDSLHGDIAAPAARKPSTTNSKDKNRTSPDRKAPAKPLTQKPGTSSNGSDPAMPDDDEPYEADLPQTDNPQSFSMPEKLRPKKTGDTSDETDGDVSAVTAPADDTNASVSTKTEC